MAGLVSIVVPVFNRPRALVEAVESGLAQSYPHLEILIVDDGSTDETRIVAETLARSHSNRVRTLRRANGGPGLARETGRLAAQGEFVQYLDSDDLLSPRKLELQVAALAANPACGVAYGICRETESDGSERLPALRPSDRRIETMFPTFVAERFWNTVVPLYRSELCARAGPWSDLRLEEDWEYDSRIAALGQPVCFVSEVVGIHRDLGEARASRGQALDPVRLRWRAAAHESILLSAQGAGMHPEMPEMARFARELFLLCRQCAAAGLGSEARRLFDSARSASTAQKRAGWDFRAFAGFRALFGWRCAGNLAMFLDRSRSSRRS